MGEGGAQGVDALGIPAAQFVFGDAPQPAVDDAADVARGFAGAGEFDLGPDGAALLFRFEIAASGRDERFMA